MVKYRCKLCGIEYIPEEGDPEKNITPGTDFGDLPEKWCCPSCGAKKKMFKEI